eukprot:gnl/TRDRNA2_/TRDRNA2_125691_c0_seq1.p1 gnl/TRDRNA2_/TRDRNA2_125691_c0~~gnl/TRDRNA2_/TRDRNA2_125691_c0_seq1.p1  ORF type:complete len:171 (+),score=17.10 gnl/TRDRNA2_/TRDRNA2_125691_c0_seq1:22-534(+)
MGQFNYSGSNSFLDAIARHRRALKKPALTIQWGAWGEVGMAVNMDPVARRRVDAGHLPYFTNKEGFSGLEVGLQTNLPYFSVIKINPKAMFALIHPDNTTLQCHQRNFSSEFVPLPPLKELDPGKLYTLYQLVGGPHLGRGAGKPLVYDMYVQPRIDCTDIDELDDEYWL